MSTAHSITAPPANMNANVNTVILIGYLGQEPELRYTPSGQAVVRIRLATHEHPSFNTQTGLFDEEEHTEWHRLVFTHSLAEMIGQQGHKGTKLYVEGHLRTRAWKDSRKKIHTVTEIFADQLCLL